MDYVYVIPVMLICLLAGFYTTKYYIKFKSNRVIQKARIDSIRIQQVGEIWSPELLIEYYFLFNRKIFQGNGVMRIDYLLPEIQLLLFDRNGFPVLRTESGEFVGEEHIEAFILDQKKDILVEFNTLNLPHSRIFTLGADQRPTLQNTDIQFPWT